VMWGCWLSSLAASCQTGEAPCVLPCCIASVGNRVSAAAAAGALEVCCHQMTQDSLWCSC
jgi:hypothetical protein